VQASVNYSGLQAVTVSIGNRQLAIGNGLLLVSKFYGQATKGTRWMPWHFEAMKDVESCEKLRLGANIL
jgi:hypothetical protein